MDLVKLSPGNRHGLKERLDLLQVRVCEILGEKWRVEKVPGRRRVLHLVCDPGNVVDDEANDAWLNACAVLWDYRKSGVSLRSLEYSRSHSMWRCPWGELMRVKRQLSCPAVQEFVITPHGGGHDILGAKCNLLQKVQLMRARAPPHVPKQVLAGGRHPLQLCVDGTNIWNAAYQHFTIGDLGGELPLGSWVLVHGPEKKSVLRAMAVAEDLDGEVLELQRHTGFTGKEGFPTRVQVFLVADGKAQVLLGGCGGWTSKGKTVVCWLCGGNRATCLENFGKGVSVLLTVWGWLGVSLPSIPPCCRPPDYPLHGVHRMVFAGLNALLKALKADQAAATATRWVQWYLDHVRRDAGTAQPGADSAGPTSTATELRLEQAAAAEWVKQQGWRCMAEELGKEGWLQHLVTVGDKQVTWVDAWCQWADALFFSCQVAWAKGPVTTTTVGELAAKLSHMALCHVACDCTVTLWAHLWIDHMVGWIQRWGTVCVFGAFKGEGRHIQLKSEIRRRSFKGGAKGRKGGKRNRRAMGHKSRKGWGEVTSNDNLDWGLYAEGFSVWKKSFTKQEAYAEASKYWKATGRRVRRR